MMRANPLLCSVPELNRFPTRAICLPLAPRVPNTARVEQLIDRPLIQRLKGVRQLAVAHLVYPDALHSRFGHTLGVFYRTSQILQSLLAREDSSAFCEAVDERAINSLLVAALLHDAGHYPFAHSFEELIHRGVSAESLKHDKIIIRMLRGQLPDVVSAAELDTLSEVLKLWNVDLEDVMAVLTGFRNVTKKIDPDMVTVLHSILDGPLDADKLDYVQRDSLHTGNPAGSAVDEERLIDSLVIKSVKQGLGVHERGLHAAQSLFFARTSMFVSVYWHRRNRAANRMFTAALSVFVDENRARFQQAFEKDFFELDDEAAM